MTVQIAIPMSRNQIIENVRIIKRSLGLENTLCFPVLRFVEIILPQIDSSFGFNVVEYGEMTDKYACYEPKLNVMSVREDVYDCAYKDDPRHRFTLAHEVGHYFLHRDSVILSRSDCNSPVVAYCDPEWQANTFASELLMASHLIVGMDISEIQKKCLTSFEASRIALYNAKKAKRLA